MSAQLHLRVPPGALEFKKQQHQARGLSRSLIASQARGHDCKHGSLAPQQHDRKVQAAAAAATLAAAPVSSAGVAAFPALQTVVGPWLPYVMAGAAACCAGLTLMVSNWLLTADDSDRFRERLLAVLSTPHLLNSMRP
eukprot:GHRR01036210.1.p1 GENE.GHRR01036210.1~~GHRR01036210.1.p1  ORF type:complete len:138 (-),score=31.02 GHRR01036210.1:469-882(-)